MGAIQTKCPTCQTQFVLPEELVNRRARCKRCGQDFIIGMPDLEDTVAGWLTEEVPGIKNASATSGSASRAPSQPPVRQHIKAPTSTVQAASTPTAVRTAVLDRPDDTTLEANEHLRLSHVDALGAFFLFPPGLLRSRAFRGSLPRCCLGCGSTRNLHAHLVRWQSVRQGRSLAKDEQIGIRTKIDATKLLKLNNDALLDALPPVPNSPPPYDLPIPYYICNRCSPVGALMTHVRPTPEGGEICELGISSLKRAAQFLARNIGRDHPDYHRLAEEIKNGRANAWNSLPLAVRNRIEKWYDADDEEQFVCYLRDSDFAKAESGQGGLVITDKRLVFQKFASHREFDLTETIQLSADNASDGYKLTIGVHKQKPAVLTCDPTITETICSSLKALKATYRLVRM